MPAQDGILSDSNRILSRSCSSSCLNLCLCDSSRTRVSCCVRALACARYEKRSVQLLATNAEYQAVDWRNMRKDTTVIVSPEIIDDRAIHRQRNRVATRDELWPAVRRGKIFAIFRLIGFDQGTLHVITRTAFLSRSISSVSCRSRSRCKASSILACASPRILSASAAHELCAARRPAGLPPVGEGGQPLPRDSRL